MDTFKDKQHLAERTSGLALPGKVGIKTSDDFKRRQECWRGMICANWKRSGVRLQVTMSGCHWTGIEIGCGGAILKFGASIQIDVPWGFQRQR